MIVVGGFYEERCANPSDRRSRGSGLRATASLAALTSDLTLVAAVEPDARLEAEAVAGGLGVTAEWVERSERVRFNYFTPLSAPLVDGSMSRVAEPVNREDHVILAFGMIESPLGGFELSAESLILDPQQPRDLLRLDLGRLRFGRLAIVANIAETLALGEGRDLKAAAAALRREYGADVVVTKWGARGTLITHQSGQEVVGPFPTRSVWPIGTGDVFAAGFSWAWGEQEQDPVEAARFAGRCVADWTEQREEERAIGPSRLDRFQELIEQKPPRVYLAAPFFDLGQRWFVELARESISGSGSEVFSPFHEVGMGGPEVAEKDLAGLADCTAVIAWLDGDDPGTLFEVGFATAKEIPVVGFSDRLGKEGRNMLLGTGAELHDDLSTAVYRTIWAAMGMALEKA
jgi:nucleoside 2-deoxyribosyltransferase